MSVHITFETPQDVQEQVYEMVKSLGKDGRGKLKKGANEATKTLNRGISEFIVMVIIECCMNMYCAVLR